MAYKDYAWHLNEPMNRGTAMTPESIAAEIASISIPKEGYLWKTDEWGKKYDPYAADKARLAGLKEKLKHSQLYYSAAGEYMRQYPGAYESALTANEERYGELKDRLTTNIGKYGTAMGEYINPTGESSFANRLATVDNMSNQRELDIRSDYQKAGAQTQQNLVNVGMTNTTVAPTMAAGNTRRMEEDLRREADNRARLRLGVQEGEATRKTGYANMYAQMMQQQQQNMFNTITNRTDAYPSEGLYASMMLQAGQAQNPSASGAVNTTINPVNPNNFTKTSGGSYSVRRPYSY